MKFKIGDNVIWDDGQEGYMTRLQDYACVVENSCVTSHGNYKYLVYFLADDFQFWCLEEDLFMADEYCYQDFKEKINERIK